MILNDDETTIRGTITGFFHAGITVGDMSKALTFFVDILGLKLAWTKTISARYLAEITGVADVSIEISYIELPGGGFIELLDYGTGSSPAALPSESGTGHVCLYVNGLTDILESATLGGFESISGRPVLVTEGPNQGALVAYLRGPDGYLVELFEPPLC